MSTSQEDPLKTNTRNDLLCWLLDDAVYMIWKYLEIMNGLLGPAMPFVEVLSHNLLVRTWGGGGQKFLVVQSKTELRISHT